MTKRFLVSTCSTTWLGALAAGCVVAALPLAAQAGDLGAEGDATAATPGAVFSTDIVGARLDSDTSAPVIVGGEEGLLGGEEAELMVGHLSATPAPGCPGSASGVLGSCGGASNCTTFSTFSTTRPFRDGVASSCAVEQTCPGTSAATGLPKIYDVYTFELPSDCLCVNVTYNSGTCGNATDQVYPFAYFGEVTPFTTYPASCLPGLIYAGETGGSPIVANTNFLWSFQVPPGLSTNVLSLVVGQSGTTTRPGGCTYSWSFTCSELSANLTCALRPINEALAALEAKLDAGQDSLQCEMIRLMNTPQGQRSACSPEVMEACGTGYSWNSESTGGPREDCP